MFYFSRITILMAALCLAALAPRVVHGQTAEQSDQLITVIAAVDIGGPDMSAMRTSFLSFRENWPTRPFCLLRLEGSNNLFIPGAFSRDPNTKIAVIRRDGGEQFKRSDWFDLCNIVASPVSSVGFLLDIDESVISSSHSFFLSRLSGAGFAAPLKVTPRSDNNWIEPQNVPFLTSNAPSVSPTDQPSVSPSNFPSVPPTDRPSDSPSNAPTDMPSQAPSKSPSFSPSAKPSDRPSKAPTLMPSFVPSASPTTVMGTEAFMIMTLTMEFTAGSGIPNAGALNDFELQILSGFLDVYFNDNLGSVLANSQFIGTSATNAFIAQSFDAATNVVTYQSTVTATFRDSSITNAAFASATQTLSQVPLLSSIYAIGAAFPLVGVNFLQIQTTNFGAVYFGTGR